MSNDTTQSHIDTLSDLLDDERGAVLVGNLELLEEMLPKKEALIDALNTASVKDGPSLKALDAKVRRNQLLLDGALEGIREVAKKMSTLRKMRASLETYDAEGRRQTIEAEPETSVERRA